MPDFLLPDLGEGLAEAEIVTWLVQVGDEVRVDQPVVEVETAKASVAVPVPYAGTVTALHGEAGTLVPVGSPLISVSATPSGLREPGIEVAPAAGADGSGSVLIGYGTPENGSRRRRRARNRKPTSTTSATSATSATPATPATPATQPLAPLTSSSVLRVISPLVRRIAREAGLDLRTVTGTGPDGLILRADVQRTIDQRSTPASDPRGYQSIPLNGVRRATAEKLARSRREIPEATIWMDAEATAFLQARATLNADHPQPVSLVGLLARFVVAGLRRFPELNSTVHDGEIRQHRAVNLGFAAQTPRGLVVPVIHDADLFGTRALAGAIRQKTEKARDGALTPADLSGGTFTVNNYGVFGTDGASAIINHPEAGILGIGRIIDRPWVVDGELAVRKVTQLTLSFDHRVCDGASAGGFLAFVAGCVEQPVRVLADL